MVTLRRNRKILWLFLAGVFVTFSGCDNPFVRPEARDTLSLSLVLGSASEEGSRGIFTDSDFAGKTLRVVLFRNNEGSPGAEIARSNSVIQAKNGNLVAEVSFPNTPLNTSVILRGQIIDGGLVYFQGLSQPFVASSTAVDLALSETVFNKLDYWFTFDGIDSITLNEIISNLGRGANEFRFTTINGQVIPESSYTVNSVSYEPITGDRFISFSFSTIPVNANGKLTLNQSENFLSNSFSISFWVLVDEVNAEESNDHPPAILFELLSSTEQSISQIGFYEETNGLVFFFDTNDIPNKVQSDPIDPDDPNEYIKEGWNFLTSTFSTGTNGTTKQIYINGRSFGEPNITENQTNILLSSRRIAFGFSGDESNSGAIDDIRIYSEAMTAAQVLALYNATKPQ